MFSVQGDGAGGDRRQGGAGENTPTAGRSQSCYQGNIVKSELRSAQLVWLFSILIFNSDLGLWPLTLQLQAWWRGCMVRRGLGSFKKAEEGKKGKKGKKEGKKKKKKWIFSNTSFRCWNNLFNSITINSIAIPDHSLCIFFVLDIKL